MKREKKFLYWAPRVILLVISVFFFIFSLLSGAVHYGGGIYGVLMNSPNALPWLLLLGLTWFAWKNEKWGGSILLLFGLGSIYFFRVWKHPGAFFSLSLPIIVVGALFLINHYKYSK